MSMFTPASPTVAALLAAANARLTTIWEAPVTTPLDLEGLRAAVAAIETALPTAAAAAARYLAVGDENGAAARAVLGDIACENVGLNYGVTLYLIAINRLLNAPTFAAFHGAISMALARSEGLTLWVQAQG